MKTLREMREEEGFTLIELLVVIVIIGILAAIAIPTFLNSRQNAWRSAMESDLRNAASAAELYLNEVGSYTDADPGVGANLDTDHGFNPTWDAANASGVVLVNAVNSADRFCFQATHTSLPDPAEVKHYDSDSGQIQDGAC